MKVRELIAKLNEYEQDLLVFNVAGELVTGLDSFDEDDGNGIKVIILCN